ncbi:Protein phosphatase 2C family like protein [Aduncisulcus paluster]|uniref:Protein phosphatase 2C family like protein n=1 Tax=Aduncisulcus paluster TaxID=2918883 RepID=A0ABQ5K7V1_9EUKA|nr:Protein phosphatase 2C family like protein [Aduncisulcus paluster]GKT26801.1 Protein phosphatase 2C family like protein [Aduncisulcus paluster]
MGSQNSSLAHEKIKNQIAREFFSIFYITYTQYTESHGFATLSSTIEAIFQSCITTNPIEQNFSLSVGVHLDEAGFVSVLKTSQNVRVFSLHFEKQTMTRRTVAALVEFLTHAQKTVHFSLRRSGLTSHHIKLIYAALQTSSSMKAQKLHSKIRSMSRQGSRTSSQRSQGERSGGRGWSTQQSSESDAHKRGGSVRSSSSTGSKSSPPGSGSSGSSSSSDPMKPFFLSLESLDVSSNPLGDDGIVQLCSILKTYGMYLNTLNLQNTGMGERSIAAVSEYAIYKRVLKKIDISSNPTLSSSHLSLLASALHQSRGIQTVIQDVANPSSIDIMLIEHTCMRNEYVNTTISNIIEEAFEKEEQAAARKERKKTEVIITGAFKFAAAKRDADKHLLKIEKKDFDDLKLPPERKGTIDVRVAFAETVGRRLEMEDVVLVRQRFRGKEHEHLFAVFDGHGGRESAELASDVMPQLLAARMNELESATGKSMALIPAPVIKNMFTDVFLECNRMLTQHDVEDGSTALVALLHQNRLIVANVGDSRGVLMRDGRALRMSFDHKPDLPTEEERIQSLGGYVEAGRVLGALSVSRALGDVFLQPYVSAEPFVRVETLLPTDKFLILACDGVWDVLKDQSAVSLLTSEKDPVGASVKLRDQAFYQGSTDNISVVVIMFDQS